jgi:hypothetical protein
MPEMGVHDQIKKAFQDIVAPEIHALRGDIQRLDGRITGLDGKMTGLEAKIDGVDRELRTAIDVRERLAALEARRSS